MEEGRDEWGREREIEAKSEQDGREAERERKKTDT